MPYLKDNVGCSQPSVSSRNAEDKFLLSIRMNGGKMAAPLYAVSISIWPT
jgi:hypothetical protein